jgi:hypothetical protein
MEGEDRRLHGVHLDFTNQKFWCWQLFSARKKHLTRKLLYNSKEQHEAFEARENPVGDEDSALFRDTASGRRAAVRK